MTKFSLLAVLLLVGAAAANTEVSRNNEQSGRFYLFKVKPRTAQEAQVLVEPNAAYEEHPPILIQSVRIGESVLILVEQSKVLVFERILHSHKMKVFRKGLSLVEKISAHPPSEASPRNPYCDCDYHKRGCMISKPPPAGYACKCVYKGFWTCGGYSFSCDPTQHCPANCSSLSCCQTGRGDCGGY